MTEPDTNALRAKYGPLVKRLKNSPGYEAQYQMRMRQMQKIAIDKLRASLERAIRVSMSGNQQALNVGMRDFDETENTFASPTVDDLRAILARDTRRETLLRACLTWISKLPMLDHPDEDNAANDLAECLQAELGESDRAPPPIMPGQHVGSLKPGKWVLLGNPKWKRPRVGKKTDGGWIGESGFALDDGGHEAIAWWELPEMNTDD